jgi:hypothetical protein
MAEQEQKEQDLIEATFLLPRKYVEELEEMAKEKKANVNEMLVKAIATLKYFKEKEDEGAKILVESRNRALARVRVTS